MTVGHIIPGKQLGRLYSRTHLINALRIRRAVVEPWDLALIDDEASAVWQSAVSIRTSAFVSATDEQAHFMLTLVAAHRVVDIAFRRCGLRAR